MRFLYIVILFASVNLLSESIYNFQNTEDEIRFNNLEIKEYISERFGADSLYEPVFTEDTYFLWFAPFVLLLITLLVFFFRKTE